MKVKHTWKLQMAMLYVFEHFLFMMMRGKDTHIEGQPLPIFSLHRAVHLTEKCFML